MNNNLEKIQKVFGVFKILSRVFMILCFVAAGLTLVSGIMMLAGSNVPIMKIDLISVKIFQCQLLKYYLTHVLFLHGTMMLKNLQCQ